MGEHEGKKMTEKQSKITDFTVLSRTHHAGGEHLRSEFESNSTPPKPDVHTPPASAIQNQIQTTIFGSRGSKNRVKEGVKETSQIQRQSFDYMNSKPITEQDLIQWHKSHRNYFGYEYSGPQPTRGGSLSYVGRYGTTLQSKFDYPEYKTIIFALGHALKVWVKHPGGIKTVNQFINARKTARIAVADFARKHGICITREKMPGFSEHTVENKVLDAFLDPLIKEEPVLCREKLGLSVNLTSHRKKKEWTDRYRAQGQPRAKDRVMALEYTLDKGAPPVLIEHMEKQDQWLETIAKGQLAYHQDVKIVLGSMGQFVKSSNRLAELIEQLLKKTEVKP